MRKDLNGRGGRRTGRGEKTPLEMLASLKGRDGTAFLSVDLVAAGERLAADFHYAGLQPSVTASLQPRLETRSSGGLHRAGQMSDIAIDAKKRVNDAMRALGPELADVVLDFCCFTKGLEQIERERSWPARSAKLMVRTALQALARHYAPPSADRGIRHWGSDDFRPALSRFFRGE